MRSSVSNFGASFKDSSPGPLQPSLFDGMEGYGQSTPDWSTPDDHLYVMIQAHNDWGFKEWQNLRPPYSRAMKTGKGQTAWIYSLHKDDVPALRSGIVSKNLSLEVHSDPPDNARDWDTRPISDITNWYRQRKPFESIAQVTKEPEKSANQPTDPGKVNEPQEAPKPPDVDHSRGKPAQKKPTQKKGKPAKAKDPKYEIEEVKTANQVEDVFKEYYSDFPIGSDHKALCPWHEDKKTRSLVVDVKGSNRFFCHGCGEKGSVIDIVMRATGCTFSEAVTSLADRAGIAPIEEKPKYQGPPPRDVGGSWFDGRGVLTAKYGYVDEEGKTPVTSWRLEWPGEDKGKEFRQSQPDGKGGLAWNTNGARLPLYRLPEVLAAKDEVFLVEGEKDADTLSLLGLCATTNISGVNSWDTCIKDPRFLEPLKGKTVYIIPDNDDRGKEGAFKRYGTLKNIASVVKVITLTELPEGLKGGDITDYLEYHGPEKTLDDLRRYKAEAQEPTDEQLKEQSATQPEESPTTNFKPDLFADKILEGRSVVYYHGGYRLYEGGVYNEWKLWKIKKIIKGMGLGHFKEHHRREILGSLEIETSIDPDCVNPKNLINLKNGLINIDAPHEGLIPHDPRHIHSFQLPIAYDPDAECPRFERFLQEKAPDSDVRALIQEIFGYCLIPSSEFQKAFVFYGGTETGKSTLLHILGALVGKDNRCAVNFGRLTDQFYVRLLDGKLVNITSEVSISEVAAEGVLKEIIAGDEISGARKHQDPYFFTPFCRLILACNDLPKSRDASKAFFRRFLVVPFDIPTPDNQKDPKLAAHIVSHELDGVFQWALAGLQRLKNSGGFTVPESSVEALSEWQVEANPLLKAVLDFMENHAYWNGPATELYEILKDMAREGGYYQKSTWPGNSKELSKRLAKMTDLASHGIRYSRGREKGGRIIRLEVI